MEHIEFRYFFDENDEEREITAKKHSEGGLRDYEVCEMFLDFMRSIGFSEENVFKYFNE